MFFFIKNTTFFLILMTDTSNIIDLKYKILFYHTNHTRAHEFTCVVHCILYNNYIIMYSKLSFIYLEVCVGGICRHMQMYTQMGRHRCEHACGKQRLTLGVFSYSPP